MAVALEVAEMNLPEPEAPAVPSETNAKEPRAETDLVGAVFFDDRAYDRATAAGIKSAHFFNHACRYTWCACEKIRAGGFMITLDAVRDELIRAGHSDIDLDSFFVPTTLNVERDADLVIKAAARRSWQADIEKRARNSHDPTAPIPPEYLGDSSAQVDSWEVFTLADAYQEREPVTDIIEGVITAASLFMPYGPPGALKSFLWQDASVCVAAGLNFLPSAPWISENKAKAIRTNQCPVMWLDFDNGKRRTHDRFAALARTRNLPTDIPLYYYSMPSPWLEADRPEDMARLIKRVKDGEIKLIIIDNLHVIKGSADINSADMAKVMSQWRRLVDDTGAAVGIIHHQRKTTGTIARAGETLSGHNSIEAALDLALLTEREEYSDTITLKSTKTRGADVAPFSAVFTFEANERKELLTAMFYGVSVEDTRSNEALEHEILADVAMVPGINKTELAKTVREALKGNDGKMPGVNRVREYIDRLTATDKLTAKPGPRTEILYYPCETSRLTETYGDLHNSQA